MFEPIVFQKAKQVQNQQKKGNIHTSRATNIHENIATFAHNPSCSNRVEISTTAGWANTSLELQQLTESNGPYSDVVKQEMLTTNDHKEQCSLDPSETQNCLQSHGHSNGELMTDLGPSVHHGEVQKPTELTGQCSTTESGSNPQQAQLYTANPEQLSDVRQGRAEQTSPFSEQGSVVPSSLELKAVHQQDKQQETKVCRFAFSMHSHVQCRKESKSALSICCTVVLMCVLYTECGH